jgi:CheY-like chemotaxis protein
VTCAGDGHEALRLIEADSFDLVLMDLQMPVLGGEEATAQIRVSEQGTRRHLPVVAMTAHALKGDRERCLAAGMDDYIAKPIRARQLFEVVERYAPGGAATVEEPAASHGNTLAMSSKESLAAPAVPVPSASKLDLESDGSPAFDVEAALAAVGGDRGLLKEIVALFRSGAPGWLGELADALAAGDATRLRRIAHTLKNSAGYFGAGATYALALELEERGRNNDLAGAESIRERLVVEVHRLDPALQRFEQGD